MKHLFIVNPVAGGKDRSAEITALAGQTLQSSGALFEVYVTKAPMDACDKIRADAAEGGELRVYACGGDGTLNECVNGAAGLQNVAVTHFPCGTGNDFIKMFGDEKERFFHLEELVNGEVRPLDVIECCGRYSINICSVGVDARIGTEVHKYSRIPLIGGATGYVVSTVVNLVKGITQNLSVRGCGMEYEGGTTLICACNGRFYGGGFNPLPEARPDNGELEFLVVKDVTRLQFATLVGKYAQGRWRELPQKFVTHLTGSHLEIEGDEEMVVNIDGEALYSKCVNFDVCPGGVNFIVPRNMAFFAAPQDVPNAGHHVSEFVHC